jgi:hypothetical protein
MNGEVTAFVGLYLADLIGALILRLSHVLKG